MHPKNAAVIVLALALVCGSLAGQEAPEKNQKEASWQRLLVAGVGYGRIEILDRGGTTVWSIEQRGDRHVDAWMLPNGDIIASNGSSGTSIIRPDYASGSGGRRIWHRPLSREEGGETHTCQPLGQGRLLIGESYNGVSFVLEVDREKKEHFRVPVRGMRNRHHSFRTIRKTPSGTYLVQGKRDKSAGLRAMELDATGKVLNRYPGGWFHIVRLPNGNTLMSSGSARDVIDGRYVLEVDPSGEIVWELTRDELPGITFGLAAGLQRLPNGNTLICNWGGHDNGARGPAILEVTRQKEIVWRSPERISMRATTIMVVDGARTPCETVVVPKADAPESVLCVPERKAFFVSNIGTATEGYWEKDGEGYISLIGYDGEIIEERWLDSRPGALLNAPKGMAVLDGYLYIADVDRLLRVPLTGERTLEELPVAGLMKANDVASHAGEVYVSASKAGKVYAYRPEDESVREIPAPPGVNGLTFAKGALLAVSWPEHDVYELDAAGKEPPRAFGISHHFETLDGIEVLPGGRLMVSDCFGGALYIIGRDRKSVSIYQELNGPADIDVDRDNAVLVVPELLGQRVVIFNQHGTESFDPLNIRSCR